VLCLSEVQKQRPWSGGQYKAPEAESLLDFQHTKKVKKIAELNVFTLFNSFALV